MTITDEQLLEVINTIKLLDPTISSRFTDEQIQSYIEISLSVMDAYSGLDSNKIVLAVSLKTLSLLTLPENSSLSKKKIKDVEITYYQGQGRSKWDSLFDSLVNGGDISDKSLFYIGI